MNKWTPHQADRNVALWLLACAGLIFAMILLGGVTRLTHSGLSIVEWQPLMGAIPPIGEPAWQDVFAKYQLFPEYLKINPSMSLEEFKFIFLLEYFHRLMGRLIGVCFLLPLIYFLVKGAIRSSLTPKLVTIFILGGLQGVLGWYMVMSGLVNEPHVSQYRLTAHLGAAVIIYGYILWIAFDLILSGSDRAQVISPKLKHYAYFLSGLIFFMILSGGLVAGTRAGLAYGTFPLMGEKFFPDNLYQTTPFWLAAFEDITTIQFNHRMFAYLLIMLILVFSFKTLNKSQDRTLHTATWILLALFFTQIALGIATLLLNVPVALATLHQAGAIGLFTVMLYICRLATPGRKHTVLMNDTALI